MFKNIYFIIKIIINRNIQLLILIIIIIGINF